MEFYYFNNTADKNGNHEVHIQTCTWLNRANNKTYIGLFSNCSEAIAKAKAEHPTKSFDGCFWCCNSCHKG